MAERRAEKAQQKQKELEAEYRLEQRLKAQYERDQLDKANHNQKYSREDQSPNVKGKHMSRNEPKIVQDYEEDEAIDSTRVLTQRERNLRHAKSHRN